MGGFRDAGETGNGILSGIIFRQLHGAKHIVDRDLDFHYWKICDLADQFCCSSSRNNTVIGSLRHPLYNGGSFL